jgi:hypothetical protein
MPVDNTYIEDSLELNLFFLRIMKEHALFLQLGFTPKDKDMGAQAENIRTRIDGLLRQTIQAARGYVNQNVIDSGELYTPYTEEAERQTQALTGVPIDTQLTIEEYSVGGTGAAPASMQQAADNINRSAAAITNELLQFKEKVYNDVMTCSMFTANYPLLIDHIIREAREYLHMLDMLNARRLEMGPAELADEEAFWNNIMKEHAEFIDGSLDPTEKALKQKARGFQAQFERLTQQANASKRALGVLPQLTRSAVPAVQNFSNFKAQGVSGILSCKVRSIVPPLVADHDLRESNHYLRILKETIGQI